MLLIEKLRPKTFETLKWRDNLINTFSKYTLDTVPHLIIYGNRGHGKRTLLNCLIHHLYQKIPNYQLIQTEIKNSSGKNLPISFLESTEVIELTPSDYNMQDKTVIQTIIKEIAQTKSVLGFLTKKEHKIKLIVLNEAERLSKEAQGALRRTVEKYTPNFRIIMVCNDLSGIIEPLKSRSLLIRVEAIPDSTLLNYLKDIRDREEIKFTDDDIKKLIETSEGNLRRMLCFLELKKILGPKDSSSFYLDWEILGTQIVDLILKKQDSASVLQIRNWIYEILTLNISGERLLEFLMKEIIRKVKKDKISEIVEKAALFNERMKLGTKAIYHLEGFVVSAMCALDKK